MPLLLANRGVSIGAAPSCICVCREVKRVSAAGTEMLSTTTSKFLAHSEALKLWRMYAFDLSKSHGERECCLFLSLGNGLLLGDTSLLASELAQVVQLGTTHFTDLVYLDRIDVRGLKGENTLYAHGARHLAHGETLLLTLAVDLDDHAAIELDTLL